MVRAKVLNIPAFLGAGVIAAVQLLLPSMASAQTVTMDDAMLERCDSEGLAPETCACWFAAIAESEGMSEFTESDIDELAPYYQEELAACIDANEGGMDEGE